MNCQIIRYIFFGLHQNTIIYQPKFERLLIENHQIELLHGKILIFMHFKNITLQKLIMGLRFLLRHSFVQNQSVLTNVFQT